MRLCIQTRRGRRISLGLPTALVCNDLTAALAGICLRRKGIALPPGTLRRFFRRMRRGTPPSLHIATAAGMHIHWQL